MLQSSSLLHRSIDTQRNLGRSCITTFRRLATMAMWFHDEHSDMPVTNYVPMSQLPRALMSTSPYQAKIPSPEVLSEDREHLWPKSKLGD